ncbi:MAG: hypothetical protein ACJAVR_002442 [Paracoccaceae bacterium]
MPGLRAFSSSRNINGVAYTAHVRRKFGDVRRVRGSLPDRRVKIGPTKITLMLEYLKVLLHAQLPGIRGKSPLTEAI